MTGDWPTVASVLNAADARQRTLADAAPEPDPELDDAA